MIKRISFGDDSDLNLEKASEIVYFLLSNNKKSEARDLFTHFVDYFKLITVEEIMNFAINSGFCIAKKVSKSDYYDDMFQYK